MANTEAAIAHLQLAYNYHEKYIEVLIKSGQSHELEEQLRFAGKHLADARTHDPAAVLSVPNKDGSTRKLSVDQLSAKILYSEGTWFAAHHSDISKVRQGCAALEKAIAYDPSIPEFFVALSKTYAELNRRDDALVAARRAIELNPSEFKAHQIVDKMEANPNIAVQPSIVQRYPGAFIGFGITGAVIGAIMWLAGSPFGGLIAICGAGAAIVGWFFEGNKTLQSAMDEQSGQRHNKL
jgi:tetratricopeptide (TPR) repeat protein